MEDARNEPVADVILVSFPVGGFEVRLVVAVGRLDRKLAEDPLLRIRKTPRNSGVPVFLISGIQHPE